MQKILLFMIVLLMSGCGYSGSEPVTDMKIASQEMVIIDQKQTKEVESREIAECYRDIYEKAVQENTLGSLDTWREILVRLGEAGYCAVDEDNQMDMVNADRAEQFCVHAEDGQEAEIIILTVRSNGDFIRYDLSAADGGITVRRSFLTWNGITPETVSGESYQAYEWSYSAKGYLFFEKYYPAGFDGPSGHTAIRIRPLDQRCRELNRRWILPIGYSLNNMFLTDWDETDYAELEFYDLYETMHQMRSRQLLSGILSADTIYEIPAEEFETVYMSYFNIDSRTLRQHTIYNEENECYQYIPRGLYDSASTPYTPYPEVVAYEQNNDIVILTVDAVWPEKNLERAFSHEVCIRLLPDGGYQYISNRVIPSEENVEFSWYTERLADQNLKE